MKLLSRSEEMVLIAVWQLRGNAYGVTIRDRLSELTGYDWTLGAVYVPLDKLTRRGYVWKTASRPTPSPGGRSKCLYELSGEGKAALRAIRDVEDALWRGIPRAVLDED